MAFKYVRDSDLEITHTKGSGPGGQNRNKRMTGVRVVHLPTGITVLATERRSQEQNLQAALARLEEKLEKFFYVAPTRRATKKSKSSQRKRVDHKRKHSSTKSMRQRVTREDY